MGEKLGIEDCRPFVTEMAILMEGRLRENDHKGGQWGNALEIVTKLTEEVHELVLCASEGYDESIAFEAADVANVAGMLAGWVRKDLSFVNDREK